MTRLALCFAAVVLVAGCGRTEHVCATCADQPSAGASGGGSGGGSQGGSSNVAGGGQQNFGGLPLQSCALGAPDVPLVRYSSIDLEWTLDDIVGPGPSLLRDGTERSELGDGRWASPAFIQNLRDAVTARAEAAELDESQLQICEADAVDRAACVDTWIRDRGLRLYRRPLTDEQVAGYLVQFSELSALESPLAAARTVLVTMTLSPYFVFRIELGGDYATALEAPAPGGAPPIGGAPQPQWPPGSLLGSYEIAARLSHFATRMAPDRELLAAAAQNQLTQPQVVVAQLDRLLQSPPTWRARVLQHLEWLWLDRPPIEALGEELGQAMQGQTSAFIDDVLQHRNGSFTELLSSARQPLNGLLAEHYGSDVALGDTFELVDLDPSLRAGVLGQGAFLSRHPRPTLRGERILGRLLCSEVPAPPAGVPMDGLVGATPRERITNATIGNPACQSCHSIMDPTGFALEAFDDQGRLTGFDTTGELYLSSGERLPVSGPLELGQAIASNQQAKACAAQRYLEHLFERRVGVENDLRWLECLPRVFDGFDLDLNHLARQVAASDAMQRMTRIASSAVGVGQSSDPLEHALQETSGLLDAFQLTDRAKLEQYMESLRLVQQDEPLP